MASSNIFMSCATAALLACLPVLGWAQEAADGMDMPAETGTTPEAGMPAQDDGTMAMDDMAAEGSMDDGMMAEGDAPMAEGMAMAEGDMAQDDGTMPMEGMDMAEGGMDMGDMTAPDPLPVYFASGSARIGPEQQDALDQAVRTFREGDWIVLVVHGVADTVGDPEENLDLSLRRARSVADGLLARGVSIEQIQVLGRGNSELEIATGDDVPEEGNRVAMITWR